MKKSSAQVVREFGPLPGVTNVGGITFDGTNIWAAVGSEMAAIDPDTGNVQRTLKVPAHAGTAFDGKHLYQISESRIQKVDPESGRVLGSIPAPGNGGDSGLAWAEGSLWVGEYRARRIHQIDPATGKVLRTIESNRFVTGVTWAGADLWHATWEGDESELRRIDPKTGDVLETLQLPAGVNVSGLEADGRGTFYCGGGGTGKVRAVRRGKG